MIGGVLLTGGTSRRLGVDKATLVLDGETLAQRAARTLAAVCGSVVEVGPGHTDLVAVRESPPGSGPLAALAAGAGALLATAGGVESVVVFACDLPAAAPAVAALAAAPPAPVVVPLDADGRRQYACARYGPAMLVRAMDLAARGVLSLRELVETASVADILELDGFAPDVFADVDTPADAERFGIALPR